MYLDDVASSVQLHRETAQRLYMAPSLAFTPFDGSMQDYASKFNTEVIFAIGCEEVGNLA